MNHMTYDVRDLAAQKRHGNGTVIFSTHRFGSDDGRDEAKACAMNRDGTLILVGSSGGDMDTVDGGRYTNTGGEDGLITKLDLNGQEPPTPTGHERLAPEPRSSRRSSTETTSDLTCHSPCLL